MFSTWTSTTIDNNWTSNSTTDPFIDDPQDCIADKKEFKIDPREWDDAPELNKEPKCQV